MALRLLTEQHLEFLSLKGGCTGKSESTLVKTPHCWKSRVALKCHIVHTKRPFFFLLSHIHELALHILSKVCPILGAGLRLSFLV